MTIPAPPLADTLGVVLPPLGDLQLLRVLAGPEETVEPAWSAWRQLATDFRLLLGQRPELRALTPLIGYRLRRAGVGLGSEVRQILQAAQLWEGLRVQRILDILNTALAALSDIKVAPHLVGGLATSIVGYPSLPLRHSHDIDFLVPAEAVARSRTALIAAGFHEDTGLPSRSGTVTLYHRDGLPIQLHTALLNSEIYRLADGDMLRRARRHRLAGHTVSVLDPMDALLHRIARMVTASNGKPLGAMTDVAMLAAAGADEAAWERLAADAISAGLCLQAFVILSCLERTIGGPVPAFVLDRLTHAGAQADALSIDMALHHARVGHGSLTCMVAASGWRSRLSIIRWLILPSPGFLRHWCSRRGVSWTPLWYVGRPFRRAAIRISRHGGAGPDRRPIT